MWQPLEETVAPHPFGPRLALQGRSRQSNLPKHDAILELRSTHRAPTPIAAFEDILAAMESNPQLLAAMRHHIPGQEFLQLPAIVREFLPPYDELLTELATLRARHEMAGERPHPNPSQRESGLLRRRKPFYSGWTRCGRAIRC